MTQINIPNNKSTGGVLGVVEAVLGDLTAVASTVSLSSGAILEFAGHFSGGKATAGLVLAGLGIAGLVARDIVTAISSRS